MKEELWEVRLNPEVFNPKVGDFVIAWDSEYPSSFVTTGELLEIDTRYPFPYLVNGFLYDIAVKWDGTPDQYKVIRGTLYD